MGATSIEWTGTPTPSGVVPGFTFNPWRGCAKVSPACTFCYAENWAKRNPAIFGEWGVNGERVVASASMWRQPLAWNREAEESGVRRKVFCASLADVFEDREDLVPLRERLWALIHNTPHLDWLLLTKRPAVAAAWSKSHGWPVNAWAGATVEDRTRAEERIPVLLEIPAPVRFLSMEPLLESIDLSPWMQAPQPGKVWKDCACGAIDPTDRPCFVCGAGAGLDWIIVGGESGPRARPFKLYRARAIVEQARAASVPVFVKQLGDNPWNGMSDVGFFLHLKTRKGGDPAEWPADLRIRQWPTPRPGRVG